MCQIPNFETCIKRAGGRRKAALYYFSMWNLMDNKVGHIITFGGEILFISARVIFLGLVVYDIDAQHHRALSKYNVSHWPTSMSNGQFARTTLKVDMLASSY